jgi:hypothetical protein
MYNSQLESQTKKISDSEIKLKPRKNVEENLVFNFLMLLEEFLVKRVVDVAKTSRTTRLLQALKIETAKEKINIKKLSFYARLA